MMLTYFDDFQLAYANIAAGNTEDPGFLRQTFSIG